MSKGLIKKYRIQKADGTPTDPKAEYFVLRLDYHRGTETDAAHVEACRAAIAEYARAIRPVLPKLAEDLFEKYPPLNGLYGRAF
jgi:hypothetical protein